jgi:hypothetical protein
MMLADMSEEERIAYLMTEEGREEVLQFLAQSVEVSSTLVAQIGERKAAGFDTSDLKALLEKNLLMTDALADLFGKVYHGENPVKQ